MAERITLASASPRRTEILTALGIPHLTLPANIDEESVTGAPAAVAQLLAGQKAAAVSDISTTRLLLAADTVVAVGDEALGKPKDRDDAHRMLDLLQGRVHQVHTGVCLADTLRGEQIEGLSTTLVHFSPLSKEEIRWYLDSGEWEGVAGGYRIQGLGSCLIPRIEGSYSGVMGLPIQTLYSMLSRYQFTWTD
ncbi:MAG: Maf family protein [Alkalispirochaetaceae bacterium]